MKFSSPRLGGGGGGVLDSMFPGWQDKIWAKLPPNVKKAIIMKEHKSFESAILPLNKSLKQKAVFYHDKIAKKLLPKDNYPITDFRRQMARGTFIGGNPTGVIRNRIAPTSAESVFAPFTLQEQAARTKYRNFSIPALLLALVGSQVFFQWFQQREPYAVFCLEYDPPHASSYPFWMKSFFHSHDVKSVRRGYEVYRQVCATCHSMKYVTFRHLTYDNMLPEAHVKKIAATFDITDGPNDEGEMFERPGMLLDTFPSPYSNEEAGRFANGGAYPPDLSVYAGAKHGGIDYIMALLTCYREPPAGVHLRPGLYYNSVFPGGTIAMPPPLQDDMIEYEDGTPATVSQMSKDVSSFLAWAMDPSHDSRKLSILKASSGILIAACTMGMWYRWHWASLRTRIIRFPKAF